MNLEEKIEHLRQASMEDARQTGNNIIQEQKDALTKIFEDFKKDELRKAELNIRVAKDRLRQDENSAIANAQTELTGELGKLQLELKNKLFKSVHAKLDEFMASPAYLSLLKEHIASMLSFADGEEIIIYLNPDDIQYKDELEKTMNTTLTVSKLDFIGGTRGVLKKLDILIDYSFKTALEEEYQNFLFTGGM